MDHVFRLLSALTGDSSRDRERQEREDEDVLQMVQSRAAAHILAGTGARAARRLRGHQADGTTMFVVSMPDRGMTGTTLPPMMMHGEDDFLLPLGPIAMHEALMQNAMGNAMQAMMEHIAQTVVERSMQEQRLHPAVLPANESCRDALPRVVVTKEDLLDSTNSKCSVCLEEYQAGLRATRMFCGHLFCTNCIREWLRTANSCPVCRFELRTDCVEYEEGRALRMQERTARFKEGELRAMRVPDLRRVMVALEVSGEGCVEKAELISRLETAPGVEVTPDRKDLLYEDSDLTGLELPLLRSLLERHRVPPLGISPSASTLEDRAEQTEDEERAEGLQRFAAAGMMCTGTATQTNSENVPAETAAQTNEENTPVEDDPAGSHEDAQPQLPPSPPPSPPRSPPPEEESESEPKKKDLPESSEPKDSSSSSTEAAVAAQPEAQLEATTSPSSRPTRPPVAAPTVTRPRVGSKRSIAAT